MDVLVSHFVLNCDDKDVLLSGGLTFAYLASGRRKY